MSNRYSETIGSFVRTGNFPLEADYIFESESELREWASDPYLYPTLHEGLLKIVKTDSGLQLWWVIEESDRLSFKKLIDDTDINLIKNDLEDFYELLLDEIDARELADIEIWGTTDKSEVDPKFNNLKKLSEAVRKYIDGLNGVEEKFQAIVGTEEEDIIEYLKTLPYQSITLLSEALNKFLNTIDDEDVSINTLPELKLFLEGYEYTHNLQECFEDLWNKIEGDPLPNELFRTLRGVLDFVYTLASAVNNRLDNLQTELNNTQEGVGLDSSGLYSPDKETTYLKDATSVMNALRILDSLINLAVNNWNLVVKNSDTVELTLIKEAEKTSLLADVLISTEAGNGIVKKNDGIFYKLNTEYDKGELTIYVNDNIISKHNLGLSFVGINQAYYDSSTEEIVLVFNKEDGTTDTLRLPVTNLIREWVVDNSGTSDVVVLTREEMYGNGADKLSADVRLYNNKYNILTKVNNTLYVEGTANNIVHNDVQVGVLLDNLLDSIVAVDGAVETLENTLNTKIDDLTTADSDLLLLLTNELHRAELAESNLSNKLDTEITRALAVESEISNNLNTEISRATSKESDILASLNAEITRATETESAINANVNSISLNLTNEILRATTKEIELQNSIDNTNSSLTNEISRATSKESEISNTLSNLTDKVDAEISRSTDKDAELTNLISSEIIRAEAAELNLGLLITANTSSIESTNTTVNSVISSVGTLSDKLNDEVTRAKLEELNIKTILDNKINSVNLVKVNDLLYQLYIDGELQNTILIPKDEHLEEIELTDGILRFSIFTSDGIIVKEVDLTSVNLDDLSAINSQLALKANLSDLATEINRANAAESLLAIDLLAETTRAVTAETLLSSSIQEEVTRALTLEQLLQSVINTKVATVKLIKSADLEYELYVDGLKEGVINIPQDLFLKSVELIDDSILKFTFKTTDGIVTTDINLNNVIQESLLDVNTLINEINSLLNSINSTLDNLLDLIDDKADKYSPILSGVPQVEVSPDINDSSLRIPSTNWVNLKIAEEAKEVFSYASLEDFPEIGLDDHIYIDLSTNKGYRWSEFEYVMIFSPLSLGTTEEYAYPGDAGAQDREDINNIIDMLQWYEGD